MFFQGIVWQVKICLWYFRTVKIEVNTSSGETQSDDLAEEEEKEEAVNEEEEPQSPDSDIEEEIDWAALEESAEEYDSESDKNDDESDEANEIRSTFPHDSC